MQIRSSFECDWYQDMKIKTRWARSKNVYFQVRQGGSGDENLKILCSVKAIYCHSVFPKHQKLKLRGCWDSSGSEGNAIGGDTLGCDEKWWYAGCFIFAVVVKPCKTFKTSVVNCGTFSAGKLTSRNSPHLPLPHLSTPNARTLN